MRDNCKETTYIYIHETMADNVRDGSFELFSYYFFLQIKYCQWELWSYWQKIKSGKIFRLLPDKNMIYKKFLLRSSLNYPFLFTKTFLFERKILFAQHDIVFAELHSYWSPSLLFENICVMIKIPFAWAPKFSATEPVFPPLINYKCISSINS